MKKVLKYDSSYRVISGDGIEILDTLPAGIYELKAAKNEGFWFEKMALAKFEGKVYGDQDRITNKVVARFDAVSGRNLGVLLSGKKGTGKSLFAKNLAVKMSEKLPVIIVKVNYGVGMLSTISSIQGKAMVVFDEFEKMFRAECDGNSQADDIREQEKALSFFDGVETRQEKLLVLTVNDPASLSKYLLGRPGRIYYHFRMGTPTIEEIEEYLKDNLSDDVKDNRAQLASRLAAMSVSWDALSAVATELNYGSTMDETMADLNLRTDSLKTTYTIRARYDDGKTESAQISLGDLAICSDRRDDITMVFDRRVSPEKFKIERIWTKVTFKVTDIVPRASGFVLEKFEQESEDVDDKPVPDAPKIESLTIERRRSTEDLMYSAYKSGAISYL
jgi:hypothetical protein